MAISPDGSIIATGGKAISLVDAQTGKPLRKLFGHLKRTQSIVFSADGRLIVGGGSYGTTNLWEVATGRHLITLFAFSDDWLSYTSDGHYECSADGERYLAWRDGDEFITPKTLGRQYRGQTEVEAALK